MKRKSINTIVLLYSLIGLTFLTFINCGGGGNGGGSTPTPTDNFGSIKSHSLVSESQSIEEFWTKERIDKALKNPIVREYKKSPTVETTPQIPDGPQGSFLPYKPDIEKESLIMNKESFKADLSCEKSESCPSWSDDYNLYYTNDYESYPFRIMGALLVEKYDGTLGYCSASLINDKMILTAAHCVSENSSWHNDFLFCPGANSSSNMFPYGGASATYIFLYSGYFDNEYMPADYAIIVLDKSMGKKLGWLGVYYNVPSSGKTFYQYGYPSNFEYRDTLYMNVSDYGAEECSEGTPCRMAVGSPMQEGGSGGPWCLNNNNILYANGVMSQYNTVCPINYSPYFNSKIIDLYNTAKSYQ